MSDLSLSLTSPEFKDGGTMPSEYTCEGENVSPPLTFENVPEGTVSLALTCYDPDVPKELKPDGSIDHWVVFNIPPTTTNFPKGTSDGMSGSNTRGKQEYMGPCPPIEYLPNQHRYIFTLYALDTELTLTEDSTRADLEQAAEGHILQQSVLTGLYKKVNG